MTIEQKIARTLAQGDLKHDPLTTSGADVVGAMAFTERMGSLLKRVLVGNDKAAVEPAAQLLARKISNGVLNRGLMAKIARIALQEYVDARCGSCGGRGTVLDKFSRVKRLCGKCFGNGIARIDDRRRIVALGCSEDAYNKKWRQKFDEAYNVLQEHDRASDDTIRANLRQSA